MIYSPQQILNIQIEFSNQLKRNSSLANNYKKVVFDAKRIAIAFNDALIVANDVLAKG